MLNVSVVEVGTSYSRRIEMGNNKRYAKEHHSPTV